MAIDTLGRGPNGNGLEAQLLSHYPHVRRLCAYFLRARRVPDPRADADDLAQVVMLKAFRRLGTYRDGDGRDGMRSWLNSIVRHAVTDYWRSEHVQPTYKAAEIWTAEAEWNAVVSGEAIILSRERAARAKAALEWALSCLNPKLRTALTLWLEEMSYGEIAETIGVPEGTVKSRTARAREEAAALLRAYQIAERTRHPYLLSRLKFVRRKRLVR